MCRSDTSVLSFSGRPVWLWKERACAVRVFEKRGANNGIQIFRLSVSTLYQGTLLLLPLIHSYGTIHSESIHTRGYTALCLCHVSLPPGAMMLGPRLSLPQNVILLHLSTGWLTSARPLLTEYPSLHHFKL